MSRVKKPYISMVTPTRNDDYGGNMLERLQFTVDILLAQMEIYDLPAELIIVDWNPPSGRKRLKDSLKFPSQSKNLSVRIIEVPESIHDRITDTGFPYNGAVANNTGFVRARGEFSVLRVSDIIWSDELLTFLSQKRLDTDGCYRLLRCDIKNDLLEHPEWPLSTKLEYCRNNIQTKMVKMKYYVSGLPELRLNSDGDFQLISTDNIKKLRGYRESREGNSPNCDGLLAFCAYAAGIRDCLMEDLEIYKISHGESYKHRVLPSIIPFYNYIGGVIPARLFGPLFVDFMRYTGLAKLFYDNRSLTVRGIPQPTRSEYYRMCRQIVDGEISYVLNGPDWGLNKEQLDDYKVVCADWDC